MALLERGRLAGVVMAALTASGMRTVPSRAPSQTASAITPPGVWVAFRFDQERAFFSIDGFVDPVPVNLDRALRDRQPWPSSEGSCGDRLPLTTERLASFRGVGGAAAPPVTRVGQSLAVWLGGHETIGMTVEQYSEIWHGDDEGPVMVILRSSWNSRDAWRRAIPTAFLASTTSVLPAPAIVEPDALIGPDQVLNRFDGLGEIRIRRGVAGRVIRLFTLQHGQLQPSAVSFACGD